MNNDNSYGSIESQSFSDVTNVQILSSDHYQWSPTSLDKKISTINGKIHNLARFKINSVPVLRVFGKLSTGQTVVCHIHDVLPYLYIRYIGKVINNSDPKEKIERLISNELIRLQKEINFQLKQSFSRNSGKRKGTSRTNTRKKQKGVENPKENKITQDEENITDDDEEDYEEDDEDTAQAIKEENFIADMSLVKGVPFYGYHLGHSPFVKISLTNPSYLTRLTKLLHDGKIFGKFIQPFETHVPYQMQFLTDYNLFCLDWLRLKQIFFRSPLVYTVDDISMNDSFQPYVSTNLTKFNTMKLNDDLKSWMANQLRITQGKVNILKSDLFPRMSRTVIEFDTCAQFILNRSKLTERDIHLKLFEPNDTLEKCVGYFDSTRSLLNDVRHLRSLRNMKDDGKGSLFENIQRSFTEQEWSENEELKGLFKICVEKSRVTNVDQVEQLLLKRFEWLESYPTSFISVTALHTDINQNQSYLSDLIDLDPKLFLHIDDKRFLLNNILLDGDKFMTSVAVSILSSAILADDAFSDDLGKDDDANDEDDDDHEEDDEEDGNADDNRTVLQKKHGKRNRSSNEQDNFLGEIPHLTQSSDDNDQEQEEAGDPNNTFNSVTKSLINASVCEMTRLEEFSQLPRTDADIFRATQKPRNSGYSSSFDSTIIKTDKSDPSFPYGDFTHHFDGIDEEFEKVFKYIPDSNHKKPIVNSHDEFMSTFEDLNKLKIDYPDPYYSRIDNYDTAPVYYAGKKFQLDCKEMELDKMELEILKHKNKDKDKRIWKYLPKPPKSTDVSNWIINGIHSDDILVDTFNSSIMKSQIRGPTQKFKQFKYPSIRKPVERRKTSTFKMSMLTIELYTQTREDLVSDPSRDEILAIFWKFDDEGFYLQDSVDQNKGVFVNSKNGELFERLGTVSLINIQAFDTEMDLVIALISLVEFVDPDILAGFEVNSSSWGYIIERFRKVYKIDVLQRFSRVVYKNKGKLKDSYGYRHSSGVKVIGRHILNIWRQMRKEVTLGHYTLENIVFHVLHKRLPKFTSNQLSKWWNSGVDKKINVVINLMMNRLKLETELVAKLEVVEKISEQCKLLGCDFSSMIYRGSQYKVECLLVRLTKEENFVMLSPSKKQVFAQDSLQCIPLVMEPDSGFYKSPLVVLDFQSLYPSLIIAYNICYSTYLGKLEGYDPNKFMKAGVTNHKLQNGVLNALEDYVNITPNGMMFAKASSRQSLLAKMLIELLDARILVKGTMNKFKDDLELNKLYDNRQLGLKLIANVTYGYTSASYSGRMPNSDIADAIVSCGRETLLKAVKTIESGPEWGAKVVYGDTDSLFIYLPGKSKLDAFKIGKEIAQVVTEMNPSPMKLKFEKVYLPSVLLSKKRYIGWSFEDEGQLKPKFDAKGIETVRRDGIQAQAKMVEKSLNLLFEHRDVSKIKDYIMGQFIKIQKGKYNLQDFMFGKEVRIGTYKNEAYLPPGARLSMQKMKEDKRAEPQYRERIFYVVKRDARGVILRDRCLSPIDFLKDKSNELDAEYYIEKVLIPPLERIFILMGVNVRKWIKDLPKFGQNEFHDYSKWNNVTLATCKMCGQNTRGGNEKLCFKCRTDELGTITKLYGTLKQKQNKLAQIQKYCHHCTLKETFGMDVAESLLCENEDCKIFFEKVKRKDQLSGYQTRFEEISHHL